MIDLTVATNIFIRDGIGRQGIGLINSLKDDININVFKFAPQIMDDVPKEILPIINAPIEEYGKVLFWTYILGTNEGMIEYHASIKSKIKMAYTMLESSAVPKLWVDILNKYYDAAVVPDLNLVSVYKNSGVTIPIFVLPLGIMVENLLKEPDKKAPKDQFVFGMTAGFWARKNHIKLMRAFAKAFGNNQKFRLDIHGRFGQYKSAVYEARSKLNVNNINLTEGHISMKDYDDMFKKFDCYVFPSQGEGFSITPRESLALGIPTILSNNTAHKTICDSGFVVPLESNKKVPAIYEVFRNQKIGDFFDCTEKDLINSMKYVVDNYDTCLEQAKNGREWVKQYLWSNLKDQYLSLIKPNQVILGNVNEITNGGIITTSKSLRDKFIEV